jgi:hypothetical protein
MNTLIHKYDDKDSYDQRHGGPFDRGSADSYYGRPFEPHYYRGATGTSEKVLSVVMSVIELEAYAAGYEHNEKFGDKKDYR